MIPPNETPLEEFNAVLARIVEDLAAEIELPSSMLLPTPPLTELGAEYAIKFRRNAVWLSHGFAAIAAALTRYLESTGEIATEEPARG